MSVYSRAPLPFVQPVNGAGVPFPAGKLFFYTANTTTPLDTFTDFALTTPNTNPVIADANGMFPVIYLGSGTYDVILKNSSDVQQWVAEDVAAAAIAAASTTVAGILELATAAEALAGASAVVAMAPSTNANAIQQGFMYGSTGGSANAITVTPSVTPVALTAGMECVFRASSGNSAATTINYGGLGVVAVKVADMTTGGLAACVGGEIITGATYRATYSATDASWLLLNASLAPRLVTTVSSFSTTQTVTDADRGGSFRFSGLSADVILNLPAASGRKGFFFFMSNEDTTEIVPWGVTIDPNGAELIDGFATRKGYVGTRATLLCDGTGWRTVSGNWRYFSGDLSATAASTSTLAHGLGARPKHVWWEMRCVTAEQNYSIGDIVAPLSVDQTDGGFSMGVTTVVDATNITTRVASTGIWLLNKTTGGGVLFTAANWKIRIWAED